MILRGHPDLFGGEGGLAKSENVDVHFCLTFHILKHIKYILNLVWRGWAARFG